MARKLKVFRTSVGFRDAYVAAPSQAAALRAWGTDKNLFARGSAEAVTDPDLMRDALSKPGEVVYRTRGNLSEQVAALGKMPVSGGCGSDTPRGPDDAADEGRPTRRKRPKPSRAKLEAAERAIAAIDDARKTAEAEMRDREKALAKERAEMERRFADEQEALREKERRARAAYEKALKAWEP